MRDGEIEQPDQLPSGWSVARLGSVALVNPPVSREISDQTLVSFVPMAAVQEMTGTLDPSVVKPYGQVKKGFTRFQNGDVVFAKITPSMENGKIAVANGLRNGIACGTTELHVIRPSGGSEPRYLLYFLLQSSFRRDAQRNMKGTAGQLRVPADFLEQALVPIAPAMEQRRIVAKIDELFSDIDEGERCLARAEALLSQYRQSVLKAAVTGELTRDWRAKNAGKGETGAELLQRILKARREAWEAAELAKMKAKGKVSKDDTWKRRYGEPSPPDISDLPALPHGWVWATVEQLASMIQYGTSAKCREAIDGVPVLRMGNIVDGKIDDSKLKFLPKHHDEFPDLLLGRGDLLFNRTNSAELVGKSAVYDGRFKDCSFASYLIRVRLVLGTAQFVCFYLNSTFGRHWVSSVVSQQVGQANVNGSKLSALSVPLPPADEQSLIVARANDLLANGDALAVDIEHLLKRISASRQSVLRAAFSGKLVPQDINDEPASVLLQRIAAERSGNSGIRSRERKRRRKQAA